MTKRYDITSVNETLEIGKDGPTVSNSSGNLNLTSLTGNIVLTASNGTIELAADPTTTTGIVTKQYSDAHSSTIDIGSYFSGTNIIIPEGSPPKTTTVTALQNLEDAASHHYILNINNVAYGIIPSGTISTGSSGHFVSGTALPTTYSWGMWAYFDTTTSTPALTAGFYWTVWSNTTTCTIYDNGPGSTAYNFSGGASTTGSTSEITMHSVTVPGGLMGENGTLRSYTTILHTASTNSKTYRFKLGGVTLNIASQTTGTVYMYSGVTQIMNLADEARQISSRNFAFGTVGASPLRGTVNTATDQTAALTLQMSTATEYLIVETFLLEVFK